MASSYFAVVSGCTSSINVNNTPSQFTNTFSNPPPLKPNSQIAMQSIFLDARFGNIPPKILCSCNHFLIFIHISGEYSLIETINIRNTKYTHRELAANLNKQVTNPERCQFLLNKKKIDVRLRNCVLLVNPLIVDFFGYVNDGVNETYQNNDYLVYPALGRERVILGRNRFSLEPIIPKCIKVNVEEMKSSLRNFTNRQVMSIISYSQEEIKKEPLHHVVTKKEYFPLRTPILNALSIKLTDENNLPLRLLHGNDTIVKFKLKQIMFDSYILRLTSTESDNLFVENTNSNFRIQLSEPINVRRENVEVALSTAYFPSEINNHEIFRNDGDMWFTISTKPDELRRYFFNQIEGQVSPEKIFNYLRLILEDQETVSEVVTTDFEDTIGLNCKKAFAMELSPKFGRLFNKHNFTTIYLPEESYVLGKINMASCYPRIIFLRCNFIPSSMVGDKSIPLLKMIPFKHTDENKMARFEALHLDFFPLTKNDCNLLHFELTDTNGCPIVYRNVNEQVLLNLIFRVT